MLTSFHAIQAPVDMSVLPEARLTTFTLHDDEIREIADAVYRDDNPLRFESVRQAALMFERVGYTISRMPIQVPIASPARMVVGDLIVDRSLHAVIYRGREIALKLREFNLLDALARRPGRVFNREALIELAWPRFYDGDIRTIDVHVTRLRRKLHDPYVIQSVRGVGYKLALPRMLS